MKTASELMTSPAVTCHPEDSLNVAARAMWEHDCGCLPVVDDEDRIVGMITDRDACMAAYTQGQCLGDMTVRSAMSHELYTCAPETSLGQVEEVMRERQIRRLPVVDAQGRVVGVASLNDIAHAVQQDLLRATGNGEAADLVRTLAGICKPRAAAAPATSASRQAVPTATRSSGRREARREARQAGAEAPPSASAAGRRSG